MYCKKGEGVKKNGQKNNSNQIYPEIKSKKNAFQKIAAQFEKWYCTGCFCSKTAQQTTVCTFERKQI